ncbi:MAG TPA: pyridoxal-dependent decarboxylase [Nostocaceae cyanobacterium]|nr:pyridoxal-dependent decarboxylase [Nostocaceae cyanobacterium]
METIKSGNQELTYLSEFKRFLELEGVSNNALEAWFLGPRAENLDELERLIVEALRDQGFWRRNFHPGDPGFVSEKVKREPEYLQTIANLRDNYRTLLAFLKKSSPFFSVRYQGHMNWDITMPAILGYFATMLYNPNNVAFEASPATTILELLVGDDLCKMLGYTIPSEEEINNGAIRPWGHITCGGTIANIEAIWSARNLKFYPISLQAALKSENSPLQAAQNIEVSLLSGGSKRLIDLTTWELLNLKGDQILDLPNRLDKEYNIKSDDINEALAEYSIQNLGLIEFSRRYLGDINHSPVFFVPGTKHYSFPKAAAILGIGSKNMIDVPVDIDARMDADALDALLKQCLDKQQPVYTVVAVIGSTEESAVDPLDKVLELREKYRLLGLEFTVHADAAWGCYFASMIRDDEPGTVQTPSDLVPQIPMSEYATRQFQALSYADSITGDPHKSGYVPYAAGALCYRNSAMRDLVTFKAPYVAHGEAEPTVGIYGVEGSKPGAAAAAVYLSHKVIRPTKSGYGKIHGQALFNCNKLYARLLCMAKPSDRFVVVPVPRLPAEIAGAGEEAVKAQIEFIRNRIDGVSLDKLLADTEAMALMPELGPDQNILAYAFNFKHPDGTINTDLEAANRFNKELYSLLSIKPGEDIYGYRLIVSTTDFDPVNYGTDLINNYKQRLGVANSPGSTITVLRSTVLDPWLVETADGSFLDVIEKEFRDAISKALFRSNLVGIFTEIDVNQDGILERTEIDAKFTAMGYSQTEIDYFWHFSDVDKNQTLTKQEFMNSYAQFLVYTSSR